MSGQQRHGLSHKVIDDKQDVVIDAQEADADIDYFEHKLKEFKSYFGENFNENLMKNGKVWIHKSNLQTAPLFSPVVFDIKTYVLWKHLYR